MNAKTRRRWAVAGRVGLAVGSLLAAGLVAEGALRLLLFLPRGTPLSGLRDPGCYADYFADDDYWKLYYRLGGQYKPPDHPHPLLGWVGTFDRVTLRHLEVRKVRRRRPVLLYGDSFGACATPEVDCFQGILNADPRFSAAHWLLNYAVGGYGLDQEWLLLDRTLDGYLAPFVVVGLTTVDLDRSVLSVRTGQKPRFRLHGDSLSLDETPIDSDPARYFAAHPPGIHSYLFRLLVRRGVIPPSWIGYWSDEEKTEAKRRINRAILDAVRNRLQEAATEHVFLVFHTRGDLAGESPWRKDLLRSWLEEHGETFISSEMIIREDANSRGGYREELYFDPGHQHPTAHLNRLLAEEILRRMPADPLAGRRKRIRR